MLNQLSQKTQTVLGILRDHKFVVPATGEAIGNDSRQTLIYLVNQQRDRRRHNGHVYESGVSRWFADPATLPPGFLKEVTSAIGLSDLGFDESIWFDDEAAIIAAVSAAVTGGVLFTVLRNEQRPSLFEMHPPIGQGIAFGDDQPLDHNLFENVPEFTVVAGQAITCEANMQFSGFLRVIALEERAFMGMNGFLNIPLTRLPTGKSQCGLIPTRANVARTVVYAFASRDEAIFRHWPADHHLPSQLTHGRFLQLVNAFYAAAGDDRESCVQSFLTTVESPAPRTS